MAKSRKAPAGKKGLDGWVMTYGDMMSLLLTFFVLIVSFSSMQEAKFKEAALSLQAAFGVMVQPQSVIEMNQPIIPQLSKKEREDIIQEVHQLEQSLLDTGLDQEVEVRVTAEGVRFRINAPFLFESGEATLRTQTGAVLDSLAAFVQQFPYPLRIEGHTDSVPIKTSRFPSNWDLSAARAVSVARFFQAGGINPHRIAALGHGEYHPLVSNDTAKGRAKNRRVEIFMKIEARQETKSALPLQTEETNNGG